MRFKTLLIITLFLFQIFAISNSLIASAEGSDPKKGVDNKYHIKIIASQWQFVAVDLETGKQYKHRIGSFEKGSIIVFEIVSKDVQHGFSINAIDLAVATNRPLPGEAEGAPTIVEVELPDRDDTLSAFCHIFCGLGHPDMKLKFTIGKGSFWVDEAGSYVFYGILIINLLAFAFVFSKISKQLTLEPVTT